jgi:hypothetical protein
MAVFHCSTPEFGLFSIPGKVEEASEASSHPGFNAVRTSFSRNLERPGAKNDFCQACWQNIRCGAFFQRPGKLPVLF